MPTNLNFFKIGYNDGCVLILKMSTKAASLQLSNWHEMAPLTAENVINLVPQYFPALFPIIIYKVSMDCKE